MKKHIQIKYGYRIWRPATMRKIIKIQAFHKGIYDVVVTDALLIEWWLHNIGYFVTLPFIKKPKIKALNERFKHVDLMVEGSENAET